MKRTLVFIILFSVLLSVSAGADGTGVSAKAAIVYEPLTGTVFYEKNADDQMLIASTTKIMTALVALENCDIDETVTVPKECESVEGSSMYLKAGDKFTMRELLYGLLLESGNDAAAAIALHISGSIEGFAALMNAKAEALGCKNSHFANPHGLDASDHYSSARDLALIMSEAIKNEDFLKISSTSSINIDGRIYTNHNKLNSMYDAALCGKTGYTIHAGRTLVTCAEKDGMTLICVTLSDPDDWNDHITLYESVFSRYKLIATPAVDTDMGEVEVISGTEASVCVTPEESTVLVVGINDETEYAVAKAGFVYADVAKGECAGELCLKVNGEIVFTTRLVFKNSVERDFSQMLSDKERLVKKIKSLI